MEVCATPLHGAHMMTFSWTHPCREATVQLMLSVLTKLHSLALKQKEENAELNSEM